MIDVPETLRHYGVGFVSTHPSVSKNCVGVDCPFCNDRGKHVGVFIESGNFSCWKCGAKGSLYKLVKQIKGINWSDFARYTGAKIPTGDCKSNLDIIFKRGEPVNTEVIKEPVDRTLFRSLTNLSESRRDLIESFCQERHFTPYFLEEQKCLYALAGPFAHHLIIPIGSGGNEFVARDLTGANKKWRFPAGLPIHRRIYATCPSDNIHVITEGVFDAWQVGEFADGVALFGKHITIHQLHELLSYVKPNDSIVVCLDGDARKDSMFLADALVPFFPNVYTVLLPADKDPADFEPDDLETLIKGAIK